jgi:DNA-binding SARP family transcriptional activator
MAAGEPRQRALLAALLVDVGQPVGVATLVDRVWGDEPPAQARRSLQSHIARIRRTLERAAGPARAEVLARTESGYRLAVDPERVDLHRFRRLVRGEARSNGSGTADTAALREALDLWAGEPLTGVAGSWAMRMRESLRQERVDAVVAWAIVETRAGNAAMAVRPLTDLAAERPTDESVAAALMRALYAVGRPAEALERFERIRAALAESLGADPGPFLRAAHRAVLRHEPPAYESAAQIRTAPAQLPAGIPAFTGRATELARLDEILKPVATAPPIVCITGPAGSGKTAVTIHVGQMVRDRFPDGQLYVNLRGYDPGRPLGADEALAGFLAALTPGGRHLPSDLDARAARYRSVLAGRRILVVLDNASTAEQVRPLLPGSAGCAVLVTSRDSLAGLVAVHHARRIVLGPMPREDSTALLRTLIGPAADREPDAVQEIAHRCDHLPLALCVAAELASRRTAVAGLARSCAGTPLASLAAELSVERDRLDLLSDGTDPRAAVRAVFWWSVRHLALQDAAMFTALGAHPGPHVDRYAAAALVGTDPADARRRLDALARAHLVTPLDADRVAMHDLLRAYARETPPPDGALARLIDHLLVTAAAAMDALHPGEAVRRPRVPFSDPDQARAWLEAELPNLVAVSANGADDRARVQLAAVLFRFLDDSRDATTVAIRLTRRTSS